MRSFQHAGHRFQYLARFLAASRWLHYLLLALAMTLLAYAMHAQHWRWADALDNLMLDTSFRMRRQCTPEEVAETLPATRDIIMIELPHPVPRHILARLPGLLHEAKAVAFDLMLVDQDSELSDIEKPWYANDVRGWQADTAELQHAFRQSGNVVVGAWADDAWVESSRRKGTFTREHIWNRPAEALWQSARYHAHLLVSPDLQDHVVRRVPLFQDISTVPGGTTRVPCLGLALVAAAEHISPAQLDALSQHLAKNGGSFHLGDRCIPYDADGQLTIEYVGDHQCFEYGTNRVIYDRALRLYQPSDFAGKLVIIGGSDVKSHDDYPTPYGMMSGMQIHANIVATLRNARKSPSPVSTGLVFWLSYACALLPLIPLQRWPLWSSLLVACAESVLVMMLAAGWFASAHAIFPVSAPILAIALTYNAIVLYEYSRVRLTLSKFIGADMVKRALYRFAHLRPGGGRVEEASALFCDLRGFSAFAETLPPEMVARMLNVYTEMVVTVVKRFQGRPIDFAGDGVFVLFEASLAGRQFPGKAVQAALELRAAFVRMREDGFAAELPGLEIGMAVHTGRMLIGLLGSEYFLKMGAVGDVVNVAARVQELSRDCGYDVLITEETHQHTCRDIASDYCGAFYIRGHKQPVVVYGVAATRGTDLTPA